MSNRIVICKRCGKKKKHRAKGYCKNCYYYIWLNSSNYGRLVICKRCHRKRKEWKQSGLCENCYKILQRNPKAKLRLPHKPIKISEYGEQVLLGSLLGDGALILQKKRNKNPYYMETHCVGQKDYLNWKQKKLPFTTIEKEILKRINGKTYRQYRVYSRTHPELKKYYNLKYKDRDGLKKILKKLDPLGMLVWHLDDGTYHDSHHHIRLATCQLDYSDQILIQRWLKRKFGIKATIYGKPKRYYIYFGVEGTHKILNQFKPYFGQVPKCMHYKIGLGRKENQKDKAKRRQVK